jgi:nucleoside-diphosphate-sugar epimerase
MKTQNKKNNNLEYKKQWANKKVLVTGADGFMGSHLTERLTELGADVSVFVRGTSVNGTTQYTLKKIPSKVKSKIKNFICGDISSHDSIDLIRENSPQIILHLAANAYVPFSFQHPIEVMNANLIGTLNVLEASKQIPNIERIVCTSSSEIYGTAQYVPMDEGHPLNPSSPYAASKLAADRYSYSYWNTYDLPIAIIRPFNTYGPRHIYDVIPLFIKLALLGEPLTVHGTGEQSRDFTYVDDMVDAFLLMGIHPNAVGNVINYGSGKDYSIKKIAELIKEISNSSSQIIFDERRISEVERLFCNSSKAKELLGWEAKIDIEEGLKRNITWCRQNWNLDNLHKK